MSWNMQGGHSQGAISSKKPRLGKHSKQTTRPSQPIKLFVGGLTGDTTNADLKDYFGRFANVCDSFVVYSNKKPSGFGFIYVEDEAGADAILSGSHSIKNSDIDVKPALDREQARAKADTEQRRKIFVGGLPKNLCDEKLEEYFSRFGLVQKCYVVKDSFTGKTRGFGFVIFGTQQAFEATLNAPNHFIDGQEIHIKPAQARDDEMGDEPEEEFPRGRDYPKKKQVRQTKPNWELQSESYSPNARNARVDPRRGPVSGGSENEYSTYSGGNPSHFDRAPYSYHPYTPQYFGDDQYDYNGGNQTSYQGGRYPVNQRGYGSHAQGNRYPNSRTPTSKQHQPFAPYQDNFYNGKEFGKPNQDEGDLDTFIDHASPERPSPVNVNPQNGFVPIGYLQDRQLPAGIYPPGSPNEAPAASFAQNNKPQTPAAPRNPNSLIKPGLIGGFHDEPEPKSPGFDSHGVDTYSNSYNPSTRQDDSPQNGLSPPMYQQSSPQNTRSIGGFSAPIRTVQKHYSGLQQIPENESQKLSGEHKSQSTNRANQNSNHNQVHASNPGSQLDEDLPPEADDMIEGFEYYGQPQNQQDNLQKVSPSNQPDSLRLISRNQLATAINFPHVGDSLMSTTGQYPNHNSQNPGRFTASSSNMIINNNLPRQDLLGNNPAVKPQFSHKQIIQSSQKQGYSMFAPNPTPVASNFQRSNDGGSATNIQRKQMLNSDRTISHEGMFKKPANQMHPLQQPVNPNDQYYQPNMQPSGYYGPLTSLPSISDPRTPVVVSGGMHGYQNNPSSGVQDQSSLSGRSPLSNAIYTRINNQPRAYHRSEQAIGHSQSHANWTSHQQPVSPVHSNHHPPGSTPLVEKRASPVRRNQPDGNVCIPIDEDGDYDDQELQKATDF